MTIIMLAYSEKSTNHTLLIWISCNSVGMV
jgi:hypothetical protein